MNKQTNAQNKVGYGNQHPFFKKISRLMKHQPVSQLSPTMFTPSRIKPNVNIDAQLCMNTIRTTELIKAASAVLSHDAFTTDDLAVIINNARYFLELASAELTKEIEEVDRNSKEFTTPYGMGSFKQPYTGHPQHPMQEMPTAGSRAPYPEVPPVSTSSEWAKYTHPGAVPFPDFTPMSTMYNTITLPEYMENFLRLNINPTDPAALSKDIWFKSLKQEEIIFLYEVAKSGEKGYAFDSEVNSESSDIKNHIDKFIDFLTKEPNIVELIITGRVYYKQLYERKCVQNLG